MFAEYNEKSSKLNPELVPLAERLRPKLLSDVIGQEHLIGEGKILTQYIKNKKIPSLIFWGPPGVGKTTLANALANELSYYFHSLSAVESGVKELRQIIDLAAQKLNKGIKTIIFVDEIHRFSKSQQDALLHAVERGIVILIGATTENPSFEVNSALLSRSRIYKLNPLSDDNIKLLIINAIKNDVLLKNYNFSLEDIDSMAKLGGGDARVVLNILEASLSFADDSKYINLNKDVIEEIISQKVLIYDKKGENHYDVISAFIKSMRGSDPNASLFWLARMLESGEDPKFIARRMVVFASEDVGNADPLALGLAISVFRACEIIGMPECRINLSQGVTYLASAPKSNASYMGIERASEVIKKSDNVSVPLKLRNAPTNYMKQESYGKDYKYPHSYENHFIKEDYFPENITEKIYYEPTEMGHEQDIKERLSKLWGK